MANFLRIELHAADHCTLSCIGCNHGSPHLNKKLYNVEDYIPWLDLLKNNNHTWNCLVITGGEPFLLKGNINNFCKVLKNRYKCAIQVFTNAFWLTSEESIENYHVCLSNISSLQISFYKPYVEKIGFDKLMYLASVIRKKYNIEVYSFQNKGVAKFGQVYFYDIPVKLDSKHRCAVKDCTQLRSNGKLYRCTYGHFLETKIPSDGFLNSKDIIFDLRDLDKRNIKEWLSKWPLDSCSFCGCGPSEISYANWQSDSSIKNMNRGEYLVKIEKLIGSKNMKNIKKDKKFM